MTKVKTTYNRRSFLKVSAAAGGGLVLGFGLLNSCDPTKANAIESPLELPKNWFNLSGFIKIGENGVVTIMSPNPEIGQNVKTAMPMIVAEELDVDWKKVIVEQAGLDTNTFTRQVAGGSQSIRKSWKGLRIAGATVRNMLMQAAALKWSVPIEEVSTLSGTIHHKVSNRSLGFGEVASEAAKLKVPEEVTLKDIKDFSIIGRPTKNVDGKAIVTGKPLFGMDYEKKGMQFATVVHPPQFGSGIESFNKDEVSQLAGITSVFKLEIDYSAAPKWQQKAFAKNSMIVVVGNSTWEVFKAARKLKVQWKVPSKIENSTSDEERLTALLKDKNIRPARKDGDVEKAFREGTKIIESTYSAPFLPHNPMAPMNFFADVTAEKARFVGPIQTPEVSLGMLTDILKLPKEKIDIQLTRIGGGFGRRLYGNFVVEAGLISQRVGKPIKLIYSREEDMSCGPFRPTYKISYKAALNASKELIAFQIKGAGAQGSPVWPDRFPAGTVDNFLAEHRNMSSTIATGAWRAPRSNFTAGVEQAFLDEIAEAAGKDPIDFRIELFKKAETNPVGEKNDYDPKRYRGVLELVREKSNWDQKEEGLFRGVAAYFCHNSYVAQVVDIKMIDNTPKVVKVWSAVDCGVVVNPEGAKNQIEGGVIDGLGTAMFGEVTFKNGYISKRNFDDYKLIRQKDTPLEIETFFVENNIDPTGLGEPSLPPVIGALANALYQATGKRYYNQPFNFTKNSFF